MGEKQSNILIAEDDDQIRKVIRGEFERQGIGVLEAKNGDEALALSLSEHPDVIVLDVLMPKMHGIDIIKKLQKDEWGKNAQIVLLTNFADDPRVLELVEEGDYELFNKAETKLETLVQVIKNKLL